MLDSYYDRYYQPPDPPEHYQECLDSMGLDFTVGDPEQCICAQIAEDLEYDAAERKFDERRENYD